MADRLCIQWKAERVVIEERNWRCKHWNTGDEGAILVGTGAELPWFGEPEFLVRKLHGKWIFRLNEGQYRECSGLCDGMRLCEEAYWDMVTDASGMCMDFTVKVFKQACEEAPVDEWVPRPGVWSKIGPGAAPEQANPEPSEDKCGGLVEKP